MNLLDWKSVNLYKLLPAVVARKYQNLTKQMRMLCYNATYRVFADKRNTLYIFNTNWDYFIFEPTIDSFTFCKITETNLLLILAQDASSLDIKLQIYNLNAQSKQILSNDNVKMMGSTTLTYSSRANVAACSVHFNILCIVIGLENGSILLHRSSITKNQYTPNFQQWHVCNTPIKDVSIISHSLESNTLLICSDAEVFCHTAYNTTINMKCNLDNVVSPIHCTCLQENYEADAGSSYAMACDNAIYCYKVEGRADTYMINGQKKFIKWFGKHLFIVLQQDNNKNNVTFIIADVKNHIIEFKAQLNDVTAILPDAEMLSWFLILQDKHVLALHEHSFETKLKLLFQKNMYDIAFSLLDSDGASESKNIGDFYMYYADHLLQRGDSDGALNIYIRTVGKISPYKVFVKLISLRSNEHLIKYLSALEQSDFKAEYADLIYCCQKRVNMQANTNAFFQKIKTHNPPVSSDDIPINNEKDDIKLLTQNYINMYFPSKQNRQMMPLQDILLHDVEKLPEFIRHIRRDEIGSFTRQYGRHILTNKPEIQHKIIDALCEVNGILDETIVNSLLPILLNDENCSLYLLSKMEGPQSDSLNTLIFTLRLNILLHKCKDTNIILREIQRILVTCNQDVLLENVLMLCGRYKCWDGIKIVMENVNHKIVNSLPPLLKWNGMSFDTNLNDTKINIMWNTYNLQCKRDTNDSVKVINNILQKVLKNSPDLLLKVLERMTKNGDFYGWHINQLFSKSSTCPFLNNRTLRQEVEELQTKVESIKCKLTDYQHKSIEFRNNICNICQQALHLPAVYYLCQHAYHRECLAPYGYDSVCVACKAFQEANSTQLNLTTVSLVNKRNTISLSNSSGIKAKPADDDQHNMPIIQQIAALLSSYNSNNTNTEISPKQKPTQNMGNPFESPTRNEISSHNSSVRGSRKYL